MAQPPICVAPAKSGRSTCWCERCQAGDIKIDNGALRVGVLSERFGGYGRWVALSCFQVPSAIWQQLPDPPTLESVSELRDIGGLDSLAKLDRRLRSHLVGQVQAHVMDKNNWAGHGAPADETPQRAGCQKKARGRGGAEAARRTPSELCRLPTPGDRDCRPLALLGRVVVLSGTFPEVGGGTGLCEGKAKVAEMVKAFGGTVRSTVSQRTRFLVVGEKPGESKVKAARENGTTRVLNLSELLRAVRKGEQSQAEAAGSAIGSAIVLED